jgi:hypothetical protein
MWITPAGPREGLDNGFLYIGQVILLMVIDK